MEPESLFGQGQGKGHKYVNVYSIILRMLLFLHLLHLKCIDDDFRIFFFSCHLNFYYYYFLSFLCGRFLHANSFNKDGKDVCYI